VTVWRIAESCPWPARRGLLCEDVTEQMDPDKYPRAGMGPNEVIVLIDDDPIALAAGSHPGWSCVMGRRHLEPIGRSTR
jgi:hypothetical protein